MITTVFIDMWGTLIESKVSANEYFAYRAKKVAELLSLEGFHVELDDVYKTLLQVRRFLDKVRSFTLIEIPLKAELMLFLRDLGIEYNDRELLDKLADPYMDSYINLTRPIPGAIEFLKKMKARGIKLAMVSNNLHGPSLVKVLRNLKVYSLFDAVISSDRFGLRKPHPSIFFHALKMVDSTPLETVHIGDEEADILGAKRVGIKAILFKGAGGNSITPPDLEANDYKEISNFIESQLMKEYQPS